MIKSTVGFFLVGFFVFSPVLFGQTLDFTPPKKTTDKAPASFTLPPPKKVSTSQEFKSTTKTRSAESQKELYQRVDKLIPPLPQSMPKLPKTTDIATTPPLTAPAAAQPKEKSQDLAAPGTERMAPPPMPTNQPVVQQRPTPQEEPARTLPHETSPLPPKTEVYTGFPNADPNSGSQKPAAAPAPSGGGWNIQY